MLEIDAVADLPSHRDPLSEAVACVRRGQVLRQSGFDGQCGVVRIFTPVEFPDPRCGGRILRMTLPERHL